MNKYIKFPLEVCNNLGYYVYRLIDPRNGETFYVGKGKNNRIFEHLNGENIVNEISEKLKRINQIHNQGLNCILLIHRHGLTELEAFHVEAALIDAYPQLTNEVAGYKNSCYGVKTIEDIIQTYSIDSITDELFSQHKVMIIKVNKSVNKGLSLYNSTRHSWRISLNKALQAEYVLSVVNGIIKEIYSNVDWLLDTPENFPEFIIHRKNRYGFAGIPTEDKSIINVYKNKKLPPSYLKKGISNPVLYNY